MQVTQGRCNSYRLAGFSYINVAPNSVLTNQKTLTTINQSICSLYCSCSNNLVC